MGADGGGARELVRNVGQYAEPQVSPDSQWVFYNGPDEAGEGSFWKVPFEGGQPAKVWPAPCRLSPEGRRLVCFQRNTEPDAVPKAVVVPAEGGAPLRTLGWPREANALYWSPDGQGFEYIATREGVTNVWRMPLAGGREQKLTDWQTQAPLWSFAWSRDGRTLAVTRDTRNDELVLIQNFRD
jgi:Tol biopolymer transport system component